MDYFCAECREEYSYAELLERGVSAEDMQGGEDVECPDCGRTLSNEAGF